MAGRRGGAGGARRARRASVAVALLVSLGTVAAAADPSFAGEVEIRDGRGLYMECRGRGTPTVILEAGLRSRGDFWSVKGEPGQRRTVFGSVSRFTRVCEYDRPGTTLGTEEVSRSDPVPMPRTAGDAVADLHALIRATPIRGPIVLVGHSTGGLIARLHAGTHPRHIVGMVQVDALSERIQREMSAEHFARYYELNAGSLPGLEAYTDLEIVDFYIEDLRGRRSRTALRPD